MLAVPIVLGFLGHAEALVVRYMVACLTAHQVAHLATHVAVVIPIILLFFLVLRAFRSRVFLAFLLLTLLFPGLLSFRVFFVIFFFRTCEVVLRRSLGFSTCLLRISSSSSNLFYWLLEYALLLLFLNLLFNLVLPLSHQKLV